MAALNSEISADLKQRLERACVDRNTFLKVAVADALEAWLGTPPPVVDKLDLAALKRITELRASKEKRDGELLEIVEKLLRLKL